MQLAPARHQVCQHEELEQLADRVFVDPRKEDGVSGLLWIGLLWAGVGCMRGGEKVGPGGSRQVIEAICVRGTGWERGNDQRVAPRLPDHQLRGQGLSSVCRGREPAVPTADRVELTARAREGAATLEKARSRAAVGARQKVAA